MSIRNIHHKKAIFAIVTDDLEIPRLVVDNREYKHFGMGCIILHCKDKICEKVIIELNVKFYITLTDKNWYVKCIGSGGKSFTPDLTLEKTELLLAIILEACKEYKVTSRFNIEVNEKFVDKIVTDKDYYIRNETIIMFSFKNLFSDENGCFTENK